MNLHKFYYKDYFRGINLRIEGVGDKSKVVENTNSKEISAFITRQNNRLTSTIFNDTMLINNPVCKKDNDPKFTLTTCYPGLVTGIGINHELGIPGELKLGMHLNFTYGMPVIYGSSVKGVLREYFKDYCTKECDLEDLFYDIFEGKVRDYKAEESIKDKTILRDVRNRIYTPKSIYSRDIFFDAVITKGDNKGKILSTDSITPHKEGPLKNPIPITFLKIAPGCTIEFRFKLVDSKIGDTIFSANEKLALFEKILKDVGIGAKTNVGYGQFK